MSTTQPPRGIPSNLKFVIGIFIMLCGWIICFDLFLLIIGIPFFLIGMLLVFNSKKSILVKAITVAIPIIAWFICFELILHEINKPTSITILIPENFKGEFRIIEGETNGVMPTEENGRLTLIIPQNGILIAQAHLNLHQNTDFKFYYVDASNKKTKINFDSTKNNINVKYPNVIFNGVMSPPQDKGVSSDVARKLDYLYDSFTVFPQPLEDRTDSAFYKQELNKISLTDSLVKIERGIK